MSSTVDLEFIGMRLDGIQADLADVRRRQVDLSHRFNGFEQRLGSLELRFNSVEERLDHVVTRISGLEANMAEALLMLRKLTSAGAP
jgi:septal ring factor EnvC (AmiA/AmiB activator)